ncbi:hypothetical protein LSI01_04350 [Furfurilactobacillus siliginis]|uniref:Uncharacterized protein n=1 Tax=Furfurilactobacillus siliginis TaxID=348151 RepID=A0A510VMG6_9LACO|nr:hypothetical protein LSI01_04350 [Furfurilactobacillus siliginis]
MQNNSKKRLRHLEKQVSELTKANIDREKEEADSFCNHNLL